MIHHRKKFISSDTSVAAASTEVDGTDFTSAQVDLEYAKYASLTLYAKGANASATGDIRFTFAGYDSGRAAWDTDAYVPSTTYYVTLNGTTAVQKSFSIYPDIELIKLLSIQNTDASYAATVNASIFIKEEVT